MTVRAPALVSEALLLSAVCFGPLAFGAVEPWSRAILLVLLLLLLLSTALRGKLRTHPIHSTVLPALLTLILLGVIQSLNVRPLTEPAIFSPFTLSREATSQRLILWASYASLLWSAPYALETVGARRRLLWTLLGLGVFISVLGTIQAANGNHFIYGLRPVQPGRDIFGSYYNRNHAASLMSMSFLAGCGLFISRCAIKRGGSMVTAVSDLIATQAIVALLLGILLFGIAGTRSRGAILAGAISLGGVGVLAGLTLKARKGRWAVLAGLLFAGICSLVFIVREPWWVGLQEYHTLDAYNMMSRRDIWNASLRLFSDFPVFGIGMGAFKFAFPSYQPPGLLGIVKEAHNDWLQLLIEAGGAGFLALIAGLALLAYRFTSSWMRSDSWEARWISMGVLAAAAAFGIHGLVDFSFQIPGNAVVVLTLLAVLGSRDPADPDKAR